MLRYFNKSISKEVEVKTIRIKMDVYQKDISEKFPLSRKVWPEHRRLNLDIDIETGIIKKWPKGRKGELFTKIVDNGCYYLLDDNNEEVASIECGYVPNSIIPPKDGYGDYIKLIVDQFGKVTNWYDNPDVSDFEECDEDDE